MQGAGAVMDAAVVGASTTGLHSASLLAEQGMKVGVFERADDIDPVERTLIVTPRLRDYVGSLCDSAVVNEIGGYELFANGKVASFELGAPDLVVQRRTVIQNLVQRARERGVRVEYGWRYVGAQASGGSVVARLDTAHEPRALTTRHLIGADGAASRVGRSFGWSAQPTIPILQARVRLPSGFPPDVTRIWFRPHETPYFYWLIPESDSMGAVGLIGTTCSMIRRHLSFFLEEKGLKPASFQSARVPEYAGWTEPSKHLGNGCHIHLVGDAAGHVKVSTVGGLVTGFRGSTGLAQSIAAGKTSYELRRLRLELNAHLMVKKVLHRFHQGHYVELLELLEKTADEPLADRTRDEAPQMVAGLLKSNPKIVLLAARVMLRGTGHTESVSFGARPSGEAPPGR